MKQDDVSTLCVDVRASLLADRPRLKGEEDGVQGE